jgi:ribosomal protein L12E/L44/L45/RPP1/RPP2
MLGLGSSLSSFFPATHEQKPAASEQASANEEAPEEAPREAEAEEEEPEDVRVSSLILSGRGRG